MVWQVRWVAKRGQSLWVRGHRRCVQERGTV